MGPRLGVEPTGCGRTQYAHKGDATSNATLWTPLRLSSTVKTEDNVHRLNISVEVNSATLGRAPTRSALRGGHRGAADRRHLWAGTGRAGGGFIGNGKVSNLQLIASVEGEIRMREARPPAALNKANDKALWRVRCGLGRRTSHARPSSRAHAVTAESRAMVAARNSCRTWGVRASARATL